MLLFWYACAGAIYLIDAFIFSDGVADVLLSAYHQHLLGHSSRQRGLAKGAR
jgi:hypothetical protein